MKNLNLTVLEEAILTNLIDNLYAEPGFSDVTPQDLARNTGIGIKLVRGVISSLVKKDIVWVGDNDCHGEDFLKIVYLKENHWNLHPDEEWKEWYDYYQKR